MLYACCCHSSVWKSMLDNLLYLVFALQLKPQVWLKATIFTHWFLLSGCFRRTPTGKTLVEKKGMSPLSNKKPADPMCMHVFVWLLQNDSHKSQWVNVSESSERGKKAWFIYLFILIIWTRRTEWMDQYINMTRMRNWLKERKEINRVDTH